MLLMRKINLKKQLAFISSLALIAGTAMYMPANAGEILGISHSVSADETAPRTLAKSEYGFSYSNESGEQMFSNSSTTINDEGAHCDITPKDYSTIDVVLYVPDDAILNSGVRFNCMLVYGDGTKGQNTFYVNNEIIYLENIKPDGTVVKKCQSTNLSDPNDIITLNVKVKLVPAWKDSSKIKTDEDLNLNDNSIDSITYEKDTKNKRYVRVYSINKERDDGAEIGCTFGGNDIYLFNEDAKSATSNSTNSGDTVEFCTYPGRYTPGNFTKHLAELEYDSINIYCENEDTFNGITYASSDDESENKLCKAEGGNLIVENVSLNDFKNAPNTVKYYMGKDGYLYRIAGIDITRQAKSTNGYIKVEYNPLVNVTFNPDGGTFDDGTTEPKTIELPKGKEFSIAGYIPTKKYWNFLTWDILTPGQNTKSFDEDTTLEVLWVPYTYTIDLHTDGVQNPTANYGKETKVNCSNAVKEDYYLLGFSKVDGATVPDFAVDADGYVTFPANLTDVDKGTVNYYPVWKEKYSVTIGNKGYKLSEPVLKDANSANSKSNPYVFDVQVGTMPYNKKVAFEFNHYVIGYRGDYNVTFNSNDGSAQTEAISVGGTYYQFNFTQNPQIEYIEHESDESLSVFFANATITFNSYLVEKKNLENNGKITDGRPVYCDNNVELIDGKYVKNYTLGICPSVAAISDITIDLENCFKDGVTLTSANNACTVTLDENGNAESDVMEISGTSGDESFTEYVKFNVKMVDEFPVDTIDGSTNFTKSYEVEDDHYVRVYTVNGEAPATGISTIKFEYSDVKFFDENDKPINDNTLDINEDGTTKTAIIGSINGITTYYDGYYIKVVYSKSQAESIDVTFHANDGTDNTTTTTIKAGETVTPPVFGRKGYKFIGWNTMADGKGNNGINYSEIVGKTGETDYYAQWTPIEYTVRLYENTGFSINSFQYDSEYPINATDFDLGAGYKFIGFSKSYTGSFATTDVVVDYPVIDGKVTLKNLTDEDGKIVFLYAVWTEESSMSIKLGDKTYEATEEFLKDETAANSVSNPYIIKIKDIDSVEYGSKLSYEFVPSGSGVNISGSKGTVIFNSSDGTAKTGIYQVSVNGVKKYYQAEFSQNTSAENITHVKNNAGDTVIAADISLTYNTGDTSTESTYFKSDDKIELIDGNYVKNYTVEIPSTIKAKSKLNVTLKGFENGYGIGTTDNKFDITLGEDGTASTIFKVSSTWDGQDKVEYIKLNFKLNAYLDSVVMNINGDAPYTGSYKADGNNYVRVYTVRSKVPETAIVKFAESAYKFMEAGGNFINSLTVNSDGTTDISEVYNTSTKKPTNYYMQIVFNPEYTLEFCDGDTVLTTKTETVGEKYVLPENPTKAGYNFAGWYTADGTQIYSDMTIKQAHGTKVYAKWTPITYTVKLDANGGTAATTSGDLENWSISSYGTSVQLSDVAYNTEKDTISNDTKLVSRDGYELIGFSTDKNATTPDENFSFLNEDGKLNVTPKSITLDKLTTKEGSTVTLYAVWRAEPKEVKFDTDNVITAVTGNAQSAKVSLMMEQGVEVYTDTKIGTLPTPSLKGYTFNGWYYKNDKSEWVEATADTVATDEILDIISTDGSGLVAYFTQNTYAINYDDCGDNIVEATKFRFTLDDLVKLTDANDNEVTVEMNAKPEKAGYEFVGYTINGVAKNDFTETKEYFTANDIRFFFKGIAIDYYTSATELKKLSIGAEDVTIKAVWKIDETKAIINVDYDDAVISYKNAKGTTITVKPTSSSYEKFPSTIVGTPGERISTECEIDGSDGLDNITFTDYGFDVDDTECTLSKDGYVFKGWFTKDANGKEIAFITSTTFTAGLTEIYAKWEAESNLTVPENVKVSADGTVTWNGGEGAAYFRVYKVYNGITKNAKTTSSPYTFQNLTKGVEHEIYVVAYDGNGNSLKSESIKFTPVSAPENVAISEDGVVTWTGGEGAAYFRVYKVYNGITKNAKTESSPYTFQNLTEGVEHEIYVVAFDAQGNQYKSDSVKFTPEKKAVLTAPTNVKVDADGKVTWTAAENAAYYKVSKVVNGKTSTGKQVTGTEYTFQYLAKGQKHEIYVTAFDKDGNSLKSEAITVTPMTAPANVKVSEDGVVTWTKSEGAAYYRVYKKYGKTTKNAKVDATATSYTFQNLTEGVKHEIYVIAFDANGNQYKSESVMFTPEKKATLTAPTNVKVDADGNVTWTAAENAAYYKVSKVVAGKTYTGKQTTDTKYTFLSFNPGQNKTVYVTAFDKDGNSIKSASVTVKAVENLKVTTAGVVTFNKVDGASYYKVFKEYNGITKNAKTTASPYTFQTFTKGVKHDVYVKAYNASGKEIATSKTVTVTAK